MSSVMRYTACVKKLQSTPAECSSSARLALARLVEVETPRKIRSTAGNAEVKNNVLGTEIQTEHARSLNF